MTEVSTPLGSTRWARRKEIRRFTLWFPANLIILFLPMMISMATRALEAAYHGSFLQFPVPDMRAMRDLPENSFYQGPPRIV